MSDLTLGLVGVGRIGTLHARNLTALRRSLREADGVDLRIVLADVAADRVRQLATDLGVEAVGSVAELLARAPDGLLVATGTATHPELIAAGVEAGIPVFCEKPVAVDVATSLPVLEHVQRLGGQVMIGHQRRFDAGYQEARRAYAGGELGWLHTFRAVTCDMAPPPVEFLRTSGGLFRDCSVHDFDILRWLTGQEVVEVYARGSNHGDPAIGAVGDVDTALAVVTLADGTVGTVSASRYNGAGHDVRLELQGSAGSVLVGLDQATALRSAEPGVSFPPGPPHQTFADRFAAAYQAELEAFVGLVRGTQPNRCPPEDAVAAARVADAAQESLATGRPVRVST